MAVSIALHVCTCTLIILSLPNKKLLFGTTFTFNILKAKNRIIQKYLYAYGNGLNITENSAVPAQTPPFKGGVSVGTILFS